MTFSLVEFRNSPLGRQAFMKDSSLAVWEIIEISQHYQMDEKKVANHFERPLEWVKSAFSYAEAYPEEIDAAIQEYQAITLTELKKLLPTLEIFSAFEE